MSDRPSLPVWPSGATPGSPPEAGSPGRAGSPAVPQEPRIPPSIFNDVIGPVMRGPSSSHCAAAVRIGRMARDLMGGDLREVLIEFDRRGSLATTHESQGSDMGLFGGLLGWDAADERLPDSASALEAAGIQVEIQIGDFPAPHPNTYRLTLKGEARRHTMTALSLGGGAIRVVEVDGVPLALAGDAHVTLLFPGNRWPEGGRRGGGLPQDDAEDVLAGIAHVLAERPEVDAVQVRSAPSGKPGGASGPAILEVRSRAPLGPALVESLPYRSRIDEVCRLAPALPILTPPRLEVPFLTASEMLAFEAKAAREEGRPPGLWELAARYESERGGIAPEEVVERMREIVEIMRRGVAEGLEGTRHADRILGVQSGGFRERDEAGALLEGGILNRATLYATALMETKSAMGVIVAAPTAGACAALPAVCLAAADHLDKTTEEVARALLAAGIVGVFIAAHSTFAAEVCGCQAECGSGSAMGAAALVALAGGTTAEALAAASMALQNTMGLICDPVANRVEVPCLGRNVLGAANAFVCANMALAGYDPVIPLDEVILASDAVGRSLPRELRCTALGGLSVTPTSKRIREDLEGRGRR